MLYNKYFMFQVNKIIEDQKRKGVKVVKSMECSALLQTNVDNVFHTATKIALEEIIVLEEKRKTCTII